jgi:hypothetical protein
VTSPTALASGGRMRVVAGLGLDGVLGDRAEP